MVAEDFRNISELKNGYCRLISRLFQVACLSKSVPPVAILQLSWYEWFVDMRKKKINKNNCITGHFTSLIRRERLRNVLWNEEPSCKGGRTTVHHMSSFFLLTSQSTLKRVPRWVEILQINFYVFSIQGFRTWLSWKFQPAYFCFHEFKMSKSELSNLHVHWAETGAALNHVKLNIMATYRLHLPASRNSALVV